MGHGLQTAPDLGCVWEIKWERHGVLTAKAKPEALHEAGAHEVRHPNRALL